MNPQPDRSTSASRAVQALEFGGVTPILAVADLARSLAHYVDGLGFEIQWRHSTTHAAVRRGKVTLMLFEDDQGQPGTWAYVGISDADALHEELLAKGVAIRHPPTNHPWGARELQVADPDGHVLRFGSDATDAPPGEWRDGHGRLWPPQADERARGD
jgi:uncharacterized glyoxalase superfamily protein PhnB